MKAVRSKYCPFCKEKKSINRFYNRYATYCIVCARIYNAEYSRSVRTNGNYDLRILTDEDMKKELKNYKPLKQSGVSAMIHLERQFEKVCRQNQK